MKKIENSNKEVRSYFKRQIKEFQNKCKNTAMTNLQSMKDRYDPKIDAFGEDAIFEQLYNNRFYDTDIAAFVYYDDDTTKLYIGLKDEPSGDCYKITNWQFVDEKCKAKMMNAYVEKIIALFNDKVD